MPTKMSRTDRVNLFYKAQRAAWALGEEPPNWITHAAWSKMKRGERRAWKQNCDRLVLAAS